MRFTKFSLTPTILLFLVASAQAGLVHRQNRNANLIVAPAGVNLIPVQVIQDGQQLEGEQIKAQSEPLQTSEAIQLKTTAENNATPVFEALAEKIAEPIETADNLQTANALLESERKQDEQIIEQEIKQAILDENRELLQAAAIAEKTTQIQVAEQPQQLLKQAQEINTELKNGVPVEAYEAAAAYFSAPETPVAELNIADEVKSNSQLKSESLVIESLPAESPNAAAVEQLVSNEPIAVVAVNADEPAPASDEQLRQVAAVAAVTQATPTQTTTQQNFVQQLIQNSPLGQFFGQLSSQQQQQQQLAASGVQVATDQPATPAPTLPGFLNPQNAITQVQNAAQSVANATAQAFQGVQQFANNLGTQFQNTLSSLSGQQQQAQLSTADSTTQRPPGPIQSLITNLVGGNPPAGAAAAAGATSNPAQQGPFQGIISFLQGGNRPQAAAISGTAGAVAPASAGSIIPAEAGQVDNKVDEVKKDELTNTVAEPEQLPGVEGGEIDQADNEVRSSAEVGLDSLEDNNTDQLIVVEDDGSQQGRKNAEKVDNVA